MKDATAKAIGLRRYQKRYARHRPTRAPQHRVIYPEMARLPKRRMDGRYTHPWHRFSWGDMLRAFRLGPPLPKEKPTPKPDKFVLIAERNGVKFFKATWTHLTRSKYANGARAQRGT